MDWIDLAQDKEQWRTLVNTVMNLRFHKMLGISEVAAQLAASQEGLGSMKLGYSVNNEWKGIWKERVLTYLKVLVTALV
jgi:hypothetical protein